MSVLCFIKFLLVGLIVLLVFVCVFILLEIELVVVYCLLLFVVCNSENLLGVIVEIECLCVFVGLVSDDIVIECGLGYLVYLLGVVWILLVLVVLQSLIVDIFYVEGNGVDLVYLSDVVCGEYELCIDLCFFEVVYD